MHWRVTAGTHRLQIFGSILSCAKKSGKPKVLANNNRPVSTISGHPVIVPDITIVCVQMLLAMSVLSTSLGVCALNNPFIKLLLLMLSPGDKRGLGYRSIEQAFKSTMWPIWRTNVVSWLNKEAQHVHFTCDIWSKGTSSYMGITIHFLDGNWKLQNLRLAPSPVSDHSALTLQTVTSLTFDGFGILDFVCYFFVFIILVIFYYVDPHWNS
jgi:hypothetical protein